MGKLRLLFPVCTSLTRDRYFPGEPEIQFGRTSRGEGIEYLAEGMDYSKRPDGGVEAASVEDKAEDLDKDVASNVMTRPVAERA